MSTPWIDLKEYQDPDGPSGPGFGNFVWQAVFACQVGILPHKDWVKLKWGFNASALFEETLERQRLFLESQYRIQNASGLEEPDHRTLAFRFICRPGDGLLVAVIGKTHARTQTEGREKALAYLRELQSTFPYDYTLAPARDKNEFIQCSGEDILDTDGGESALAQIKRAEFPIYPNRYAPALQGLWQSGPRAHEQVWRALGGSPFPLLLNISLRCTILQQKESELLLSSGNEISKISETEFVNGKTLALLKQWNKTYTERRLKPWSKLFYLQVHFASTTRIDDGFYRIAGTTLALGKDGQSQPGYQLVFPRPGDEMSWRRKLKNLDPIFSTSHLAVPRLSEIADLDEVVAAMRLPYSPPEDGFPDLNFVSTRAAQE